MKNQELSERTLDLVIKKGFDELTDLEEGELSKLIDQEGNRKFIESLLQDKEKLIDYISSYTKVNEIGDESKLEMAKKTFLEFKNNCSDKTYLS